MTERITIAKTEITMLRCWELAADSPFCTVRLMRCGLGGMYHDHACITPTTGFMFADGERKIAEGWIGEEEKCC